MPFVIGAIEEGSPNTNLEPKDLITSVNGMKPSILIKLKPS
jgi:hypothetical protein